MLSYLYTHTTTIIIIWSIAYWNRSKENVATCQSSSGGEKKLKLFNNWTSLWGKPHKGLCHLDSLANSIQVQGVFLLGPPLNLLSLRGLIRLLSFSSAIHLWSFSSPKKDGKSSPSPVEKKRVTESDVHRKESFQKVLFQIVSNAARHNDLFFRDDATTKSNERCKEFHCVALHIVPSIWR